MIAPTGDIEVDLLVGRIAERVAGRKFWNAVADAVRLVEVLNKRFDAVLKGRATSPGEILRDELALERIADALEKLAAPKKASSVLVGPGVIVDGRCASCGCANPDCGGEDGGR